MIALQRMVSMTALIICMGESKLLLNHGLQIGDYVSKLYSNLLYA